MVTCTALTQMHLKRRYVYYGNKTSCCALDRVIKFYKSRAEKLLEERSNTCVELKHSDPADLLQPKDFLYQDGKFKVRANKGALTH